MSTNSELVSEWYKESSLDGLYKNKLLKEGVLLEFYRPLYSHWAVCVKVDGMNTTVAHRGSNNTDGIRLSVRSHSVNKAQHGVGTVVIERLVEVLKQVPGQPVRINNERDAKKMPRAATTIIEMVNKYKDDEKLVGEYNLVSNNCEHFVNLCRYGDKSSLQVENVVGKLFG